MNTSKKFQAMIADAEAVGYEVKENSEAIVICQGKRGIQVFADRTAIELGLQLDAAKPIRSIKAMREALKLK